jgi:hypothetical protein
VEETVHRSLDGRVTAVTERLEWQRVRPWWAPWRR